MQKIFLSIISFFFFFQSPIKAEYDEYFTYADVNFIVSGIFLDKIDKIQKGQIILVRKHQNNFSGKVSAIHNGKQGSIEIPNYIELFKNRKRYQVGESYVVSDLLGITVCNEYDQNLICKIKSNDFIPFGESLKILKVQYQKTGTLLTIAHKNQEGLVIHSSINTMNNLKTLRNEKFFNDFKRICPKYYNYAKFERYTCLSERTTSNGDAGESWKERDEFSLIYSDYPALLIGRKYKNVFGRLLRLDAIDNKSYILTIEDIETFEEKRIPLTFDFNNQLIYSIKVTDTFEENNEAKEKYRGKGQQFFK